MAARNLSLAFDSPSTFKPANTTMSPMTELAFSFKTQTSIHTPKRNLSLSLTDSNSPLVYNDCDISPDSDSGFSVSPCSDSPTMDMLNSRSQGNTREQAFKQLPTLHDRLVSAKLFQAESPVLDKENIPLSFFSAPESKSDDKVPFFNLGSPSCEFAKPSGPAPASRRHPLLRRSHSVSCASPQLSSPLRSRLQSLPNNLFETDDMPSSPRKRFFIGTQDNDDDDDSDDEDECDGYDDGFGDIWQSEQENEEQCVSSELAGLFNAPLQNTDKRNKSKLSPDEGAVPELGTGNTPKVPREENLSIQPCGLFQGSTEKPRPRTQRSYSLSLKRAKPQSDLSPVERKKLRGRCQSAVDPSWKSPIVQFSDLKKPTPKLHRSMSVIEPPTGLHLPSKSADGVDMIGDGSKSCALPTISGQHQDLKAITPDTLSKLMDGEYDPAIGKYFVIDCRFPYEYEGGHIKDALNLYKKEEVFEHFLKTPITHPDKRVIVIFHCEFSSKRGPRLCRYLRNKDRDFHGDCYPNLFYPELYILEGGYKEFFGQKKEYCEPQEYLPMVDKNHQHQFKLFKTRSKSWHEGQFRKAMRPGLNYNTKPS